MPLVPIPPPPELLVCDLAGTTIYDRGEVPAAFADAYFRTGDFYGTIMELEVALP